MLIRYEQRQKATKLAKISDGRVIEPLFPSLSSVSQDSLGSTSHVANAAGQLLESYRYDLYGRGPSRQRQSTSGEQNWPSSARERKPTYFDSTGQLLNPSTSYVVDLFAGERWIPELGLYDDRNRFMSPELGRFLQPDPIGFKGDGSNLYRYCGNDWANRTDPMGLQDLENILKHQDGAVMNMQGHFGNVAWVSTINMHHTPAAQEPKGAAQRSQAEHPMKADSTSSGSPSRSKDPKTFQKDFNKKYGKPWQEIMKARAGDKYASKIQRPTMANAPKLDVSHTNREVAKIAGHRELGQRVVGTEIAREGPNGTIYLGKEHFLSASDAQVYGTYAHELGNLVAERLTGDFNAFGEGPTNLDPGFWDGDSGAAVERRLFPNNGL